MMRTLILLRYASLVIAALSIAAAFIATGHWVVVGVLMGQMAFWFALPKQSVQWRTSCLLVMYVALAVVGILLGSNATILLAGTLAALAAWDLLNFNETLKDASDAQSMDRLIRSHLRSLSLAMLIGGVLSVTALAADLDLPFVAVGALALALVASLARAVEYLWNANG